MVRIFERIAFSAEFPHVVMRAFAIDILRELAHALAPEEREPLIAKLRTANLSPFPSVPRTDYREFRYVPRPATSPQPEDGFHLDYDFNKYPGGIIPGTEIIKDLLNSTKYGIKNLYYANFDVDTGGSAAEQGCSSGGCTL